MYPVDLLYPEYLKKDTLDIGTIAFQVRYFVPMQLAGLKIR
jgi:hypothetical protein